MGRGRGPRYLAATPDGKARPDGAASLVESGRLWPTGLGESAMFRYKALMDLTFRARKFANQKTEGQGACSGLNRMTPLGRPISQRLCSESKQELWFAPDLDLCANATSGTVHRFDSPYQAGEPILTDPYIAIGESLIWSQGA
jgi:hypothetical protein